MVNPAGNTKEAAQEIQRLRDKVAGVLQGLVAQTVPIAFTVLSMNRAVVYANEAACKLFGVDSEEEILGRRPGEIISCVHANKQDACGSSVCCEYCGNVKAVLGVSTAGEACEESRLLTEHKGRIKALNLRVQAYRLELGEDVFALCYLTDISREKYREMLETLFLHDSLNALGGILGAVRIMRGQVDSCYANLAQAAEERTDQLIREVQFFQTFFAAEQGEFVPAPEPMQAVGFLNDLKLLGGLFPCAEDKRIIVDEAEEDAFFVTDRHLLQRSMENLLKNALEASSKGDEVHLGFMRKGRNVFFYVRSRPFMPQHIQAQLFQRTFSTKRRGLGLGTYSARMFVTNYLGGSVSFESSPDEGTVFWVQIPVD
ncbi:sensor histidine kinase [Desulfovibrio subterraneus]|uniref:histidine kinase n=1 Tax=Desulfovibrio subterraneus TaxID=2718620 RepID=A0A7J0BET4_9BACT|nr:PAS domain-containing sensor histidine kinase [Desulfovibrio subterraneus]GFM31675.1 sensor histidine kinase [Desulfovibrio subterraneus]